MSVASAGTGSDRATLPVRQIAGCLSGSCQLKIILLSRVVATGHDGGRAYLKVHADGAVC